MKSGLDVVREYLAAVEAGDVQGAMAHFHPDVIQIEHPNGIKLKGDRRDLAAMTADGERGRALLASQSYRITNAVSEGNRLAVQVHWEGVLAVPMGPLAAGDRMMVESGMFFEVVDGKITSQMNYDCVPPLGSV